MKSKIKKKVRNIFFTILLFIGTIFPNSGIIKQCDDSHEDSDDVHMFI